MLQPRDSARCFIEADPWARDKTVRKLRQARIRRGRLQREMNELDCIHHARTHLER